MCPMEVWLFILATVGGQVARATRWGLVRSTSPGKRSRLSTTIATRATSITQLTRHGRRHCCAASLYQAHIGVERETQSQLSVWTLDVSSGAQLTALCARSCLDTLHKVLFTVFFLLITLTSFRDFARWIAFEDYRNKNKHFRPQSYMCPPCKTQYGYVIKVNEPSREIQLF